MNFFTDHVKKYIALILTAAAMFLCLTGCENKEVPDPSRTYQVYYIASDESSIEAVPVTLDEDQTGTTGDVIDALITALETTPDGAKYHTVLDESCGFSSAVQNGSQVTVDFDDSIMKVETVRGILIRAALTRTLTQVKGIDSVSCTVDGASMLDSNGMAIGPMSADSFIDNAGAQISAEEKTQLTLYFANESGDSLVKVNRTVVYSGNISMDKLVVEQLLAGPEDKEDAYPVMNPETDIINVTTQDGICYVNLSSEFLSPVGNVTNDVAIYSIVDSLIELDSVNRVQFLVDSDSNVTFRETVSLNDQFERNLDLVKE